MTDEETARERVEETARCVLWCSDLNAAVHFHLKAKTPGVFVVCPHGVGPGTLLSYSWGASFLEAVEAHMGGRVVLARREKIDAKGYPACLIDAGVDWMKEYGK
jgi:hypothetical protein